MFASKDMNSQVNMKHLILTLSLICSGLLAQSQTLMDDFTSAMKTGQAAGLSKYLDNAVQLNINGNMDVVNRNEAVKRLQQFFGSNEATAFKDLHQGASRGKDARYFIGQLVAGDITWRTYTYVKTQGEKEVIAELRIER
jgi:hypothetical protein